MTSSSSNSNNNSNISIYISISISISSRQPPLEVTADPIRPIRRHLNFDFPGGASKFSESNKTLNCSAIPYDD
jgi:hypothetical protein